MKRSNIICLAFMVILALLYLPVQAQQVPESRHWIVEAGPQLVQISAEGIHINQPDPKGLTYYGIVSTHINLPVGKPWKIDFDLKFGQLRSAGVGIGLFNGSDLMGWVGADGWYKQKGCFVGKSNEVAAPQANTDWHKFEFSGDGTTVIIKEDGNVIGSGSQSGTPNTIKIGDINGSAQPLNAQPARMLDGQQSELWVKDISFLSVPAASNNEAPVSPTNAFVSVSHQEAIIPVQDSDNALYCVMGDTVRFAGTTSGQHRLDRRALIVNDQPYSDSAADPNEDGYSFDWKPTAPGTYKIAVRFTLQKPFAVLPVKDVTVTVLPKAPLALQQFTKPVPASCPVTVQPADTAIFHPARIEFFLNGQSIGTANQSPFQVTLPISKQTPGTYSVSYQAYDAQGARLSGESETVTVPVRVQLTMPTAVSLVNDKDTVSFKSNIVPDLKIVRVDYSVDDQRVASTTLPPYDASASLSAFKSGSHSVKSEVLVEDGETFCNPPTTLTLTNQPDDARLAQLVKEEADKQARIKSEQEAQARAAKMEEEQRTAKQKASTIAAIADATRLEKQKVDAMTDADIQLAASKAESDYQNAVLFGSPEDIYIAD